MKTDALIGTLATLVLLLGVGSLLGLLQRRRFSPGWLIVAAALVLMEDCLLTRGYGVLPRLITAGSWNWQGKLLALAATLIVAALPAFGWRPAGLTLQQKKGSLRACLPVAILYCAIFVALAWTFPSDPPTREDVAFQLTMPGLEEESFYRGLLLLALDRAFRGRVRLLGVEWGWGAILSSLLFGLTHAFGYAEGAFTFDGLTMALTAGPSLLAVWMRYRSGSVVLPILIHNFGNSIGLIFGALR